MDRPAIRCGPRSPCAWICHPWLCYARAIELRDLGTRRGSRVSILLLHARRNQRPHP